MRIDPATWELRSTCPCCGQGGLVFASCPQCHHVVLVCAELGTVFPDPRDLTRRLALSSDGGASCPSCGRVRVRDHANATADQIEALGFTPIEFG